MGNAPPKSRTVEVKQTVAAAQEDARARAQNNIAALRASVVTSSSPDALVAGSAAATILAAAAVADTQLARNGDEFTKADLVSIVVALQPELAANVAQVQQLNRAELRAKIRTVVYDPARYMPQQQQAPVPNPAPVPEPVMVLEPPKQLDYTAITIPSKKKDVILPPSYAMVFNKPTAGTPLVPKKQTLAIADVFK